MPGENPLTSVLAINEHSLDSRGNLKSFVEQYGEYALAKELDPSSTMRYTPFVLAIDAAIFGVPELAGKPLVLTNSSLKHIRVKHGAQIDVLNGLVDEMRENLLAYEDPRTPEKIVFVLQAFSEGGNRLVSIVKAEAKTDGVEVSQVRSVHGRGELSGHISDALAADRRFWVNERTGDWLRNPKNLPAEAELSSETQRRLLEKYYTRFPYMRDRLSGDGALHDPTSRAEAARKIADGACADLMKSHEKTTHATSKGGRK